MASTVGKTWKQRLGPVSLIPAERPLRGERRETRRGRGAGWETGNQPVDRILVTYVSMSSSFVRFLRSLFSLSHHAFGDHYKTRRLSGRSLSLYLPVLSVSNRSHLMVVAITMSSCYAYAPVLLHLPFAVSIPCDSSRYACRFVTRSRTLFT